MNFRLFTGSTVVLCTLFASCYPIQEPRIQQGQQPSNQPPPSEQQLRSQREEEIRLRTAEEELRRQQAQVDHSTNQTNTTPTNETPPARTTSDYPFANKVPGKDGFVFSPYNNKVVDVRDIPTGTLVQDPTYPASEKKYFRVP